MEFQGVLHVYIYIILYVCVMCVYIYICGDYIKMHMLVIHTYMCVYILNMQ